MIPRLSASLQGTPLEVTSFQDGSVTREAVTGVQEGNGLYQVRGVWLPSASLQVKVGDVVSVEWRGGVPRRVVDFEVRRGSARPFAPPEGGSVVEELFLAVDPATGKLDVFFRNADQVTALKLPTERVDDTTTTVVWGKSTEQFYVNQTDGLGNPLINIFKLNRKRNVAYPKGKKAKAEFVSSTDLSSVTPPPGSTTTTVVILDERDHLLNVTTPSVVNFTSVPPTGRTRHLLDLTAGGIVTDSKNPVGPLIQFGAIDMRNDLQAQMPGSTFGNPAMATVDGEDSLTVTAVKDGKIVQFISSQAWRGIANGWVPITGVCSVMNFVLMVHARRFDIVGNVLSPTSVFNPFAGIVLHEVVGCGLEPRETNTRSIPEIDSINLHHFLGLQFTGGGPIDVVIGDLLKEAAAGQTIVGSDPSNVSKVQDRKVVLLSPDVLYHAAEPSNLVIKGWKPIPSGVKATTVTLTDAGLSDPKKIADQSMRDAGALLKLPENLVGAFPVSSSRVSLQLVNDKVVLSPLGRYQAK